MNDIRLVLGDSSKVLEEIGPESVNLILTDPPYPDYYKDEYLYREGLLDSLERFSCRQFVFWSAKVEFPLSYTAIHIWDKKTGCGSEYERIFERNGHKNWKMFRHYLINSTVAAQYTGDVFTGHKSQKPIKLIMEMVEKYSKPGDIILDPFMGSGTVGVACKRLGRGFIGVEIDPGYYRIAEQRILAEKSGVVA